MPPVAEAETNYSADPSEAQDPQGTEHDALDHEGPPGLGADPTHDPVGITDPASGTGAQFVDDDAPSTPLEGDWDDVLLSLAEKYEFTPEAAKAYGSPELFKRAITDIDRNAAKWGKQYLESQQKPAEEPKQETQTAQPTQQAAQPSTQQLYNAFEKYNGQLNPDEWDEGARNYLNGLNDHYHKLFSESQSRTEQLLMALAERQQWADQRIQQYTGQQQADADAQFERALDTFVASKGEEYADVYGRTASRRLAADSPLLENRRKLATEMIALEAAYGDKFTREELFEKANAILNFDKVKQTARQEIAREVKARQQTAVARPTGQQPRPKQGREAAIAALSKHPLIRQIRNGN